MTLHSDRGCASRYGEDSDYQNGYDSELDNMPDYDSDYEPTIEFVNRNYGFSTTSIINRLAEYPHVSYASRIKLVGNKYWGWAVM